ncbi:MAG TPA: hypothetical protein PKW33_04360 [Anaerolineaceae bacterium]|nr:hypothetical protein [Anaerolineaceae bacterium]HPN50796.1 hypothetical protein [Anaerolineaceae bacterium]
MKAVVDFTPHYCPNCGTALADNVSKKSWRCSQCGLAIQMQSLLDISKVKNSVVVGVKQNITGGIRLLRRIPSSIIFGVIGIVVLLIVLAYPDLIMSGNPLIGLVVFLIGLVVIIYFPSRQP